MWEITHPEGRTSGHVCVCRHRENVKRPAVDAVGDPSLAANHDEAPVARGLAAQGTVGGRRQPKGLLTRSSQ